MMLKRLTAPLIVGALVLAGCETNETETAAADVQDTAGVDAVEQGQLDQGDLEPTPGELSPIDRSGVRGSARVEREGDELLVVVEAEGLEPGAEYIARVHEGGCTESGVVLMEAGILSSGDDGTGSVQYSGGSASVLEEGEASVQVYGPEGEPVACAAVETT